MVRGEHLVEAIWARDKTTLWNALKRLMVPLYLQSGNIAIGIFVAVVFLLFVPFPTVIITSAFPVDTMSWKILCMTAVAASIQFTLEQLLMQDGLRIKICSCCLCTIGRFGCRFRISEWFTSSKK